MLTESHLRTIRLALTTFYAVVSLWGLTSGSHWLVLVSLSFLATSAILPSAKPVLYWPIGLLGVIVTSFGGYCFLWLTESGGVDSSFSRAMFAVLIVGFFGVAATRLRWAKYATARVLTLQPIVTSLMILPSVLLVVIVTYRFFDNPTNLISGFIAGGDHNAHNEITHNLLAWSGNVNLESPITINTYPKGLHFLVANLIAITGNPESIPRFVQELRMGAWFEWVQLAAFCQLAILCVMKGARGSGIKRALLLAPILFVFSSMDNFGAHLFWSGFTTSLGITWLFLIPFALPMVFETRKKVSEAFPMQFLWFLFLGIGAWLMYQPYAVVFAAAGIIALCIKPLARILKSPLSRFGVPSNVLPSTLAVVLILVIVLGLYLFLGRYSPAVTSLLLDGSTTRPFFYTVCMWALLAVVILHSKVLTNGDNSSTSASVFLGLISFTFAMMLIVLWTSDFGFTNQPYYVQKMLWVILFVSIPIVIGGVLTYFEQFLLTRNDSHLSYYATAVCVLLLTPLVMGRYPTAAFKHGSVDWFAKGLMANVQRPGERATAFVRGDNLGSHVSNLALRTSSSVVTPIEFGLLGNPYLMCRFINRESVSLVYSSDNGAAEMFAAGCNSSVRYVIDGTLHTNPPKEYFGLPADIEVSMTTSGFALQHAKRGVLPFSKSGNLATGYNSTIVFSRPANLRIPKLELSFLAVEDGPQDPSVSISMNGKEVAKAQGNIFKETRVGFSLGEGSEGDPLEISINCAWTDDEIRKVDPFGYAPACLELLSIKIASE